MYLNTTAYQSCLLMCSIVGICHNNRTCASLTWVDFYSLKFSTNSIL